MEKYRSNLIMGLNLVLVLFSYLFLTQIAQGNLDDFECVDIYKQPAFQHPLLKDHKIQEKFSFDDEKRDGLNKNETKDEIYYSLPKDQICPEGTVAILKQRNRTESFHPDSFAYPGQHFGAIENIMDRTIYRGVEAGITVHNVHVKNNQYSKGQIWIENGPRGELNSIQVGWAVHPRLYGDPYTHFTIYWTGNGYKNGCYNTQCPGFVIVTRAPVIGVVLQVSFSNITRYLVAPEIFQDGLSGNWALKIDGRVIGYWPRKLFTHLNNGATIIRLGGNTFSSPDGLSPPMGNGHFPGLSFDCEAYFRRVRFRTSRYNFIDLEDIKQRVYTDNPCYKVSFWNYLKFVGIAFSYGGRGGFCGI